MSWLVNIMVYTVIAIATLAACLLILSQPHYPTYGIGHTMAINLTKVNNTSCQLYWLGGTDYDSFIRR